MIQKVQDSGNFLSTIESSSLILADFYADWCEPCKWLDVILQEVEKEIPELIILKIDTDKHLDLTHQYELRSVPVLMLFKNSKIVWRMNGFLNTPDLLNKIKEFYT